MTGPVRHCQLHTQHNPTPLVIVRHHAWPLGMGGPDLPSNWVNTCDTGHRNVHFLMGPTANGMPMPTGGTPAERALAQRGVDEWTAAGKPGDPHAAYGLSADSGTHGPASVPASSLHIHGSGESARFQ